MPTLFKTTTALCLGAAIIASAGYAASHAAVTNKAVAARHAQMQMISYHTGILGAIAKGEMEYSSDMVDAAATNLRDIAKLNGSTMWLPGTEQGAVDGSRAKAEMWSNFPDVISKITDLANAADAMIGAPDQAAVGAKMGAIGGACKACHELYRGPKT